MCSIFREEHRGPDWRLRRGGDFGGTETVGVQIRPVRRTLEIPGLDRSACNAESTG